MGGTMRLGLRPTVFDRSVETWSKARKLYGGSEKIWERHRHRYEINPEQVQRLEESGLPFVGKDEKGERMQILELKGIVNVSSICGCVESPFQITPFSWVYRPIPNSARGHSILHRPS
jgi:CTP synthase (UTP-ammonia lyase)